MKVAEGHERKCLLLFDTGRLDHIGPRFHVLLEHLLHRFGREIHRFGGIGGDSVDLDTLDTSKLVPGQRLPDGSVVATDWKGDVMIIRPGDRGVAGL